MIESVQVNERKGIPVNEKPECQRFIIAAIRTIRPVRKEEKSPVGVAVRKVYDVAKDLYTKEEFIRALNEVIKKNLILCVAHYTPAHVSAERAGEKFLAEIHPKTAVETSYWHFDTSGQPIGDSKSMETPEYGGRLEHPRLYVIADGIGDKTKRKALIDKIVVAAKEVQL